MIEQVIVRNFAQPCQGLRSLWGICEFGIRRGPPNGCRHPLAAPAGPFYRLLRCMV